MLIARIKFAPWDKSYDFNLNNIEAKTGDWVVVDTESGKEAAKICSIYSNQEKKDDLKPVIAKASFDDINSLLDEEKKEVAIAACQEAILRHKLEMKLIDVHVSAAGSRYNFAFVSEGRVDFRELVKDLAARLGANIRLTQIGSRDEAKLCGDCGPCGRSLCCDGFMTEFTSISSEMAEAQQVVHRGSDRISGMCGRLMCCLSYEYEGYKELAGELPPIGTRVNMDGSKGVVVSHHVLKQSINVKLDSDKEGGRPIIIEVDINKRKQERAEKEKDMNAKKTNMPFKSRNKKFKKK